MNSFHAFLIAIIQGVTELFPVSSLGHAVVLPAVLGWSIDLRAPTFLPFLVVLHLGTAAALLLYFWRDWLTIAGGVIGGEGRKEARRLLGLVIVATLPAAAVGFAFEKLLRSLFGSPLVAAAFLVVNAALLFAGDRLRRRRTTRGAGGLDALTIRGAFLIGCWQCAALIPGISRSGATMVGGRLVGLDHKEAARFSFLIATPIILGAAILEVPKLPAISGAGISTVALTAGLLAGATAYLSIAFLMRYFRRHNFDDALLPFASYCAAAGTVAATVLLLRG